MTGETKIRETDGLVVLFGYRGGTWLDEAEQAQFAGLEEPFAVVHKVTLYVIAKERDRDAAPASGRVRRAPLQLYQRVQQLVQRVAVCRWLTAQAQRHKDGGAATAAFRKRWEAPGIAAFHGSTVTIVLFMTQATRLRWAQAHPTGSYRTQQFAPPGELPAGTVSVYTDGSSEPRTLRQPKPVAGWPCQDFPAEQC